MLTINCENFDEWIRHYVPVVKARYVRDYTIWLRFKDGVEGEVDFTEDLWGPVFEPLRDIEYFRKFKVKGSSIEWPNGADFAPEFLHLRALGWEPCEHLRPRRATASKPRRPVHATRSPRKTASPRSRVKRPI